MPSKALLRPPRRSTRSGRVPGAREAVTGDADVEATLARRDEVIHDLDDSGSCPGSRNGHRALPRPRAPRRRAARELGTTTSRPRAVVVATGSAPRSRRSRGCARPTRGRTARPRPPTRSRAARRARRRRRRLRDGAGLAALGASVTLVEGAPPPAPAEEAFACELVAERAHRDGVDIRTGREGRRAVRSDDGGRVTVDARRRLDGRVRRAAGRDVGRAPAPTTSGSRRSASSPARRARGRRPAARRRATTWLYAIGDVNGRKLLTHMGKYQARDRGRRHPRQRRARARWPTAPRPRA